MSATKPPRLATWLLTRSAAGPERESLIGDLVEQYQHRRSAIWYWRQTFTAILLGAARDVRDHPLLALRAVIVGWVIYVVPAPLINSLSHIVTVALLNWLLATRHYSFWAVFWAGRLPTEVLIWVACAAGGRIVARLHRGLRLAMVGVYGASVLCLEAVRIAVGLSLDGGRHPMTPAMAVIPIIFMIGRPLAILAGGLWDARSDVPPPPGQVA